MNIKKTDFWKTFDVIRKNKKKSLYIVCFDILFFTILLLLNQMLLKKMTDPTQFYNVNPATLLTFTFFYFVFLFFIYSLLKYFVLLMIKSIDGKSVFEIKGCFKFMLLNLIISLIILSYWILISMLLVVTVKPDSLPFVGAAIFTVSALFFYLYLNTAHILFVFGNGVWESIKKSFSIIFTKFQSYSSVLIIMGIVMIIIIAFAFLSTFIMQKIYSNDAAAIAFQIIYNTAMVLVLYLLVFFNRILMAEMLKNWKY